MNTNISRLRTLIDAMLMQAQMETSEKRKAMILEHVERLEKKYAKEKGKERDAISKSN